MLYILIVLLLLNAIILIIWLHITFIILFITLVTSFNCSVAGLIQCLDSLHNPTQIYIESIYIITYAYAEDSSVEPMIYNNIVINYWLIYVI